MISKHKGFDPQEKLSGQRIFNNQLTFKTDLFKLEVADCHMNKSWVEGHAELEAVEHVHFFHTYDSDGRKMNRSNIVAGHFHEIEFEEMDDGKPVKIKSVSGPMREVKRKKGLKFIKVAEPVHSILEDTHTHKIKYRRSEEVTARQISAEAINIATSEAEKTAPVDGVQVGSG